MRNTKRWTIVCLAVFACQVMHWADQADGQNEDAPAIQLRALGSLGAAYIYTSHGYVGITADTLAAESYSAEHVQGLMTELINVIELNIKHLRSVQTAAPQADREFFESLTEVYVLVQVEAQALADFANSGQEVDAAAFEEASDAAWKKLKVVLGKDDPAEQSPRP